MSESFSKKEREKKKKQNKQQKAEKKLERKESSRNNPDNMYAYLDENGNLSSQPPDPSKKMVFNAEDIEIGVPKHEETEEDLTHNGIVTFFNDSKGYGFIKDLQTQESIFVHANSLTSPIKENNKVSFEIGRGPRGTMAINVKLVK
jgi:cold shock CspA family protein